MFKVNWTDEAESDLENILLYYIEQAGLRVASEVFVRIKEQIEALEKFPERCRPGRVAGTKEYVISRLPYIVVVDISADVVVILNVMHTARKYPPEKET